MFDIQGLLYIIPAVLFAISMHEFAHGLVSYKLGDPTPKVSGRISLNPMKHLDPFGTLALIFLGFGWAKPVMVNPNYYKKKKLGMLLVAIAGPVMNFIIAFLSVFIIGVIIKFGNMNEFTLTITTFLRYMSLINIGLGVFNLIPIPPLDGSKILGAILPERTYFKYMQYERYGFIILMVLLVSGILFIPLVAIQTWIISLNETIVNFILQIR